MPSKRSLRRARLALMAAGAQAATGARDVTVTGLDAWAVRATPSSAAQLIVAVRTSAGVTGYGETSANPDPSSSIAEALLAGEALAGSDALASVAAMASLSGTPPAIRGAVDIALLDVRGKVANAPVYDLLAGRTRVKARAMAALSGTSESQLMKELSAAREAGFRAFSVPVLLPEDTPVRGRQFFSDTVAMLERLRQAGADDLVLDCGGRTSAAEAAGLAARLESFHLMWMDEPTARMNDVAVTKISHDTVTPVGWGRTFTSIGRFQDLLRMQVIDVLRPDAGLNGISACRRAAALAEAYYTAIAPFHRGGPVGTAAALQIAASVPNFVIQEVAFSTDERQRRLDEAISRGSAPKVVDGFFELPTGPGLGIEVDESALREFAA